MQDRVQVFNQESQLLIRLAAMVFCLGCFRALPSIMIDKNNRVFTSEIFPGRVQQFRYVTDSEADKLRKEKDEIREKKAAKVSDK